MKRIQGLALMLAAGTLAGFAPSTFAQGGTPAPATQVTASPAPNPVSDTLRQLVARYAKNMVGAAELMPADKYDFKPTPQEKLRSRIWWDTSRNQILDSVRKQSAARRLRNNPPSPIRMAKIS